MAIAEGEGTSLPTSDIVVDRTSTNSEVEMTDSGSNDSIEVDGLAASRLEVTPAISVLLLSKSSMAEVLNDGASVVTRDEILSFEVTMLGAVASVSTLPMLVGSID